MNKNLHTTSFTNNPSLDRQEQQPSEKSLIAFEAGLYETLNENLLQPSEKTVQHIMGLIKEFAPQRLG